MWGPIWPSVSDALHQFKVELLASGCTSSFKRVCFRFSVYSSREWNAMATWNGRYCKLWSGPGSAALSKFQTALRAELKLKYYFWQYITMVSFPFHQNKMPQSWRAVSQVLGTKQTSCICFCPFFFLFFFPLFCNLRKNSKRFASWDAMAWVESVWSTDLNAVKIRKLNG